MTTAREGPTATLLANGNVLVAGGVNYGTTLLTAELYHPATGKWTPTGSMSTARQGRGAALLPNGKVLVVGCCCYARGEAGAELYDPRTGTWSRTSGMTATGDIITVLPNGKALVMGGCCRESDVPFSGAQLYDPRTNTWSAAPTIGSCAAATLLQTGQVLAIGCFNDPAYISSPTGAALFTSTTLGVSPALGPVRQAVMVSGAAFGPADRITFHWDSPMTPALLSTVAAADGSVVARMRIPAAVYGSHTIVAVDQATGLPVTTSFLLQPRLTLAPPSGAAGALTVVAGDGFAPREAVTLRWDRPKGPVLGVVTSSPMGSFAHVRVRVPSGGQGQHVIYGIGRRSHARAAARFVVR